MSVAFCLPIGPDEPPCSTLFSHLYVEHAGGRGFFQYLSEEDLDAVAATCQEADQEVSKFRWSNFLRKVKQRADKKETKEAYWISKVNKHYDHIPIIDVIYVKEIDRTPGVKGYLVKLKTENWINERDPLRIYVNIVVYDNEEMEAREDLRVCRMDTYNFRQDAKINDVLIDNRPSHVMCFQEHILNEQRKRASKGERLLYD